MLCCAKLTLQLLSNFFLFGLQHTRTHTPETAPPAWHQEAAVRSRHCVCVWWWGGEEHTEVWMPSKLAATPTAHASCATHPLPYTPRLHHVLPALKLCLSGHNFQLSMPAPGATLAAPALCVTCFPIPPKWAQLRTIRARIVCHTCRACIVCCMLSSSALSPTTSASMLISSSSLSCSAVWDSISWLWTCCHEKRWTLSSVLSWWTCCDQSAESLMPCSRHLHVYACGSVTNTGP